MQTTGSTREFWVNPVFFTILPWCWALPPQSPSVELRPPWTWPDWPSPRARPRPCLAFFRPRTLPGGAFATRATLCKVGSPWPERGDFTLRPPHRPPPHKERARARSAPCNTSRVARRRVGPRGRPKISPLRAAAACARGPLSLCERCNRYGRRGSNTIGSLRDYSVLRRNRG